MPVPLWTTTSKAEAKYNVVTEFPQLGLHAAAASGNVGLVDYALKHGQPINSVLDGVLPIHAAAAGGHPQVVKKLIEHGADVNAPRLPRRYFSDKNRDASAPIVGTSGSTPLHFAAANGNTNVITLLLLHGAHPDRADKYGVTPEALAQENNWVECAKILHDWVLNKDRDLREREALLPNGNGAASPPYPDHPEAPESSSFRRRLHVKQSIDTALNMLKSTSHSDNSLKPLSTAASPPQSPAQREFDPEVNGHHTSRRPSLPHTLHPPAALEELRSRKPTSPSSSRRPRSAGTGAGSSLENEPTHLPHGRGGQGRKLGGKLSLLGIFKKAQHAEGSDVSNSSTPPRSSNASTPLPLTPTSSTFPRTSPGPPPEGIDPAEVHHPVRNHAASNALSRGLKISTPTSGLPLPSGPFLELESSPTPQSAPPLPSALELHNVLASKRQQGRDRSRSNATTVSTLSDLDTEDEQGKLAAVCKAFKPMPGRDRSGSSTAPPSHLPNIAENRASADSGEEQEKNAYPSGILRGHRRTGSNSQTSSPGRTLRFDSLSTPDRIRKEHSSAGSQFNQAPQLKTCTSSQSLKPLYQEDRPIQLSPSVYIDKPLVEDGSPVGNGNLDYSHSCSHSHPPDEEDEDDAFNQPDAPSRADLRSFEAASPGSLSPLFGEETSSHSLSSVCADLPFSIRRPPPVAADSSEGHLQVKESDRRGRGDSISSTCTTDSANAPQCSRSGSTIGSSASPMLSTPSGGSLPLPSTTELDEDQDTYDGNHNEISMATNENSGPPVSIIERRAQMPLDIDIRDISSHAEVDALVERTKQDILDFASAHTLTTSSIDGNTPLSAKLAAYGESLALQRKLKEKEKSESLAKKMPAMSPSRSNFRNEVVQSAPMDRRRSGVERQLSLGKRTPPRTKSRKDPRRPSTAEGVSSRPSGSFFAVESAQPLQSSSPISPPIFTTGSTSFDERRQLRPPPQGLSASLSTSLFSPPEPLIAPTTARFAVESEDDLESFTSEFLNTEMEPSHVIRHAASFTSAGARNKPLQGRSTGSAKKLNRMGFTVIDQAARPTVAQLHHGPGKLRGGLKSIMQTLTGKT